MLKLLLFLFTSILISCETRMSKDKIDPAFRPYLDEVIEFSKGELNKNNLRSLKIGFFDNKGSSEVGVCKHIFNEILIDKNYWARTTEEGRLEIIMHEIGHCVLNRYHTNVKFEFFHDIPFLFNMVGNEGFLKDGCPSSVMNPFTLNWFCFIKHKNYYQEELFKRTDKYKYEAYIWRLDGNE